MSTGGSIPLQKGIYGALGGAVGLSVGAPVSSVVSVYDEPPPDVAFPFVTIGDDELNDHGTRDTDGFEGFFKIQIWSQGERGRSTIKTIADAVYSALHKNLFAVNGFTMIVCRFASMPSSNTLDGINWQTEMKFTFIMQAN